MSKKKNKAKQKPKSARQKFKKSAAYLKSSDVDPYEKKGSPYREKLRGRQKGQIDEGSNVDVSPHFVRHAQPSQEIKKRVVHSVYKYDYYDPAKVLVTESYNGPASRTTRIMMEEIPPVEKKGLCFKPCFLVAEQSRVEGVAGKVPGWKISRYVGHSNPDGSFSGQIDVIAEMSNVDDGERYLVSCLAEWCKNAMPDVSSMENHLFPEARKVTSRTSPYNSGKHSGLRFR